MSQCVAMHGNSQCPNDAQFIMTAFQKSKEGKYIRFNEDVFCEDDLYEFSMYYSNYLGLKVIIKRVKHEPVKVQFT